MLPAEPFVKWAGGKRRLAAEIVARLPSQNGGRYFEPFLGGGAIFFELQHERALLSDLNEDLIRTFTTVREDVEGVIDELSQMRHNATEYYRIRAELPKLHARRAARFIYLNKTCFNGLYRVNLTGDFNVPFGRHKRSLLVCDEDQLRAASLALAKATLRHGDFGKFLRHAQEGDTVYLDPPYTTAHSLNGFVEYNARIFNWSDQGRLAQHARRLAQRGVHVLVSNADHKSIRALYSDRALFKISKIERPSTVAGSPSYRSRATELLIQSRD